MSEDGTLPTLGGRGRRLFRLLSAGERGAGGFVGGGDRWVSDVDSPAAATAAVTATTLSVPGRGEQLPMTLQLRTLCERIVEVRSRFRVAITKKRSIARNSARRLQTL